MKTSRDQTSADDRISAQEPPYQPTARVFDSQHHHPKVDSDHIRIIPVLINIEGIGKPVAAPDLRAVLRPKGSERGVGQAGAKIAPGHAVGATVPSFWPAEAAAP